MGGEFSEISKMYINKQNVKQFKLLHKRVIGLRHCVELNYGNNVTSAASFIIIERSECYNCSNLTSEVSCITATILLKTVVLTYYRPFNW